MSSSTFSRFPVHVFIISLLLTISQAAIVATLEGHCLWRKQVLFSHGDGIQSTTCPLPVDDATNTTVLQEHTPWTHYPICTDHAAHSHSHPACVFTAAAVDDYRGLSIVTTPDAASDAAAATHGVRDVLLPHQPHPPYEVREIPGKGKGGVATRRIRRGESILAERSLLLARLDLFAGEVEDDGAEERHAGLLAAALAQLPEASQTIVMSLARSRTGVGGGSLVEDVLRTNGLGVSVGGAAHTGLYPRISRLNHACRPNTFWRYSPRSLVVEFVALRDIDPGEEITHSYTQKDTTHETQHELLHHWGFRCTCAICASPTESAALDAKHRRLQAIQAEFEAQGQEEGSRSALGSSSDESHLLTLAEEMMDIVDGEDALRAPRGAYSYHLVLAAQAFWAAGHSSLAREYTSRALSAAVEYGGPDDEHAGTLREVLKLML